MSELNTTAPEPSEEELDAASNDVEGHGIAKEAEDLAPVLDVNFGCA